MAGNNGNTKRNRSCSSDGGDNERAPNDKKLRLEENIQVNPVISPSVSTSPQLVQSINAEWSRSKRSRSVEPDGRNVRAQLRVTLSSSNPEPNSFLMDVLTSELQNISETLTGAGAAGGTVGAIYSPLSTSPSSSSSRQSSLSPRDTELRRLIRQGQKVVSEAEVMFSPD